MMKKDDGSPKQEQSFEQKQREEWVSQWIDDLNEEKKPREEAVENSSVSEEEKKELYEILDTLRRVKSLQPREEKRAPKSDKPIEKGFSLKKHSWILAAVLILALVFSVPPMLTGNGGTPLVYAMEAALENVENYKATISFQMVMDDRVMQETTTELIVGEEGAFHSTTQISDREITRIYPGENRLYTLYSDRENFVEISYMAEESLDFYQEIFLMESILQEIQDADEIKEMGKESLNGRETTKYHYRYHEEAPYHQLWVDRSTDLPIKVVHFFENGDRMVRTMEELALNLPEISRDLFNYEVADDMEVHYTSPEAEE